MDFKGYVADGNEEIAARATICREDCNNEENMAGERKQPTEKEGRQGRRREGSEVLTLVGGFQYRRTTAL